MQANIDQTSVLFVVNQTIASNLIPEEKKMKACICKNCLVKYREEQKL